MKLEEAQRVIDSYRINPNSTPMFKNSAPSLPLQSFPEVAIRVTKPFFTEGQRREVGDVVSVIEPDAHGLVKRGRAEFV
jgi:hypothetical protein